MKRLLCVALLLMGIGIGLAEVGGPGGLGDGRDVRNMARGYRVYVQKKMGGAKGLDVEMLLRDKEVVRSCFMAHLMLRLGKERTFALPELCDKEYVAWLAEHPEVVEKLVFGQATGRKTLGVLRTIWLKEGKKPEGMLLNMALGAALLSSCRTPEECEVRYDFL